jgi:3-hydroxyacyl-CoA dehydrogenase/enoyl-CoA hydratase/3-hydroxybutyryl-CoA epimerase
VLCSGKTDSFIAGAEIDVLREVKTASEATHLAKELQDGFLRLEQLAAKKPVVCAIHGSCMGGGTEMALACTSRIVSDSAKTAIALPEVKLGVFPGAGGTQRLPRLIGIAAALDMILTGRSVRAHRALKMGLADQMVAAPILLQVARTTALEMAQGLRPYPKRGRARLSEMAAADALKQLSLEDNPVGRRVLFTKAREALLKKTRGNYPGPEKAMEVLRIGIEEGLDAGYAAEADRFGQLLVSPQAKNLIGIFFATQELKKDNGTDNANVEARAVHKLGMLGGGFMGGGIASVTALQAKTPVRIKELDDTGIRRSLQYVRKILDEDVARRRRTEMEADRLMQNVSGTTDMSGVASADLVIEAVFEDLALKQKVLAEFEATCRDDAIFASNTSSLPITQIAAHARHRERVLGMHYFSPVEKMPLLEIIATADTADWVTATAVAFGKRQGKTVIVVGDGTGFYTSRILGPYMNESAWLLHEAASIELIDEALMDWGFPVGPMTLLDEVGIDVAAKVGKIVQAAFGERMQAPAPMDALVQDNRKGRKNGRGLFRYENGKKSGVDSSVYALFGQGLQRKALPKPEVQRRVALQLVSEALRCLEEGILRSPRDGDIGAVFGLGFPPFRGGPFAWIDQEGAGRIADEMNALRDRHGIRFEPPQILRDHAKGQKRFRPELQ